jgi:hypothetical protein
VSGLFSPSPSVCIELPASVWSTDEGSLGWPAITLRAFDGTFLSNEIEISYTRRNLGSIVLLDLPGDSGSRGTGEGITINLGVYDTNTPVVTLFHGGGNDRVALVSGVRTAASITLTLPDEVFAINEWSSFGVDISG